jgi:hypothetical protein
MPFCLLSSRILIPIFSQFRVVFKEKWLTTFSFFTNLKKEENFMYDVTIIGAGFSGAYATLELAKDNYKILLVESREKVIGTNSASYNQRYKLHSGVHYFGDAVS